MTRKILIGLGALALVIAAGAAWAQGPGRGFMMKQMISARLDEALAQANVTPEQRTAIYASRDRAFASIETSRPDRRAQRDQVLALFEADQLDPAQLLAVDAQNQRAHDAMKTAIGQAIVEVHDTLTPEQRKIVADFVRAHGPGMHGPGAFGPRTPRG